MKKLALGLLFAASTALFGCGDHGNYQRAAQREVDNKQKTETATFSARANAAFNKLGFDTVARTSDVLNMDSWGATNEQGFLLKRSSSENADGDKRYSATYVETKRLDPEHNIRLDDRIDKDIYVKRAGVINLTSLDR